jgi:flagellar biosynthetic protein FliR
VVHSSLLDYFLVGQLSAFLLIFCRIGAAVMMMPGFGEVYVTTRTRLMFALAFSLLLTPLLQAKMPALPSSGIALTILLMGEILVGAFIGLIARAVLSVVHVAGTIIAFESSLASATVFDPIVGGQTAVVSNLLTITALTLFFVLNLHYLVLAALVQSYDVFPPGQIPAVGDMNMLMVRLVADCFSLGVMLAAPHIVFSLLFYLAGGLMTRLMPNFQVFFIMMPAQILLALFLMFAILPVIMDMYGNFMQEQFMHFFSGPGY